MKHDVGKEIARKAAHALEDLLVEIPRLHIHEIVAGQEPIQRDHGVDFIAEADFDGQTVRLFVQVKSNGQPRVARDTAYRLREYLSASGEGGIPMIIAPYLSERAQAVCKDEQMAYLDLEGNAHISFGSVYIDRHVSGKPVPEQRALRSLFSPKSARILRLLLADPNRAWKVVDLSSTVGVSIGLVSTLGAALRKREWAEMTDEGLRLTDPNSLLDAWAEVYQPPKGEELRLYTHLHGKALADKLAAFDWPLGSVAYASFSAAEHYAPYVRQGSTYFYADAFGAEKLIKHLNLTTPAKGANVIIRIPDDIGVLFDAAAAGHNLLATSPVQTYLDLMRAGERGAEGARHLRDQTLGWQA